MVVNGSPRSSSLFLIAPLIWLFSGGQASAQTTPDPHAALRAQLEEGVAAQKQGNPKAALAIYTKALEPAERSGDQKLLAQTLSGLGWAEWATAQYDKALVTRRRALELVKKLGDTAGESILRRGLGETYYSLAKYEDALNEYRQGIEAAKRANRPSEHGLMLANMGSTYRNLGRLDDALKVLEESVAVLRPLNNPGDLSLPLTFLGIVTRARGEYDRSIAYYNEALATVRAEKNRRQESQVLGNLGNVYLDLGRYDRAVELYRQSLKIAEEIQYTAQIGFANNNLGSVLNILERPAEAMPHFEAALKIWRASERRAQLGWTLNGLGVLHMRERRNEPAALQAFDEALKIAREIKEGQLEGYLLTNLGDVAYNRGQYERALESYDQALALARSGVGAQVEYQALSGRGVALRRLGRLEEAVKNLQDSARIVNDMRANVSSDNSKIAYLDTKQAVFHDLAVALADAGRTNESFEASESVRARALADLLSDRFVKTRAGDQAAFLELRKAVNSSASESVIADALTKLRQQNRELASLVSAETTSAEEAIRLAAALGNATIVEYLLTEEELLIWTVRADGIEIHRTKTSPAVVDKHVRSAVALLKTPSRESKNTPRVLIQELQALHELLIAPIASRLPRNPDDPVVIVPHGSLLLLPFGLLSDASGSPLVERHTLSSAPALSVFRFVSGRPTAVLKNWRKALVVADPSPPADAPLERLPAAQAEGEAIRRRIGAGRVTLLTGPQATEAVVKRSVAGADVVHLATHGLVSEQRPLASSLLLSEGEGEDGYLRADEIFGLQLQASLVVLSGCSTGLGRLSGDGMLGLTRAFLYAGTPSLIVSYWDISDAATVFLMDRFYAALGRGLGTAAALRAAQLEARQRYPHPAYWAGFALIGQPR